MTSSIWNPIWDLFEGSTGYNPIGSVASRIGQLGHDIEVSNTGGDTLVKIEPTHDLDFHIK